MWKRGKRARKLARLEERAMAAVHARYRYNPRPNYLPTAVQERLSRTILPSDTISQWERGRLQTHGISPDFIDSLTPDVVRVRITLPTVPVPEIQHKIYIPRQSVA